VSDTFIVPYSIDSGRKPIDQRLKIGIVQDGNMHRLCTIDDELAIPDTVVSVEQHIFFEDSNPTLVFYKDVKAYLSIQEKHAINMFLEIM
jgi:hypothetical protein